MINIAELLKDCPTGMELDCSIYENVTLVQVKEEYDYPIVIETPNGQMLLSKYGCFSKNELAKCVIFPKGKTTWEGFVPPYKFKDGDILVHTQNQRFVTSIYHNRVSESIIGTHCILWDKNEGLTVNVQICYYPDDTRFATEEEKQKLFDAIKANGYKWNAETKTLEKLTAPSTPEKFYIRIGDIPSEEKSSVWKGDVVVGYEDGVSVYDCVETDGLYRIVMPFPLKEEQGMTYECLIQEITQYRYEIENPRKVYLVSGIEVGKGHDNEPLIKDVKILKDLTEQFNTKNDNTEENKTLEKLVESNEDVDDKIVMSGIYFDREHYADEVELHLGNYEIEIRDNKTYAVFKNQKNKTLKKLQKFKDGDVLFVQSAYSWILIYKESENDEDLYKYVAIPDHTYHTYMVYDSNPLCYKGDISKIRLATEEEKAKLFQAIKDNGYHWNTETKTLEKLPKFQVGDNIVKRDSISNSWIVSSVSSEYYGLKLPNGVESIGVLPVSEQDNWELVPNKFDINTLKPFKSEVLVRNYESDYWKPAIFGFAGKDKNAPFCVEGGNFFNKCIPYEGNEHLLHSRNDCDEFYKIW